jgi:hypothetical protein
MEGKPGFENRRKYLISPRDDVTPRSPKIGLLDTSFNSEAFYVTTS